jgi:hypothetical protein
MTLVGLTALSVEIMHETFDAVLASAASTRLRVPRTLLVMASLGFSSISGTCL